MSQQPPEKLRITPQSKIKRGRKRASYDRKLVYQIIDEAMVAYLGLSMDGRPFVLPTSHWRDGDRIYWHGASTGRMTAGVTSQPVCLTLTLLDGLVLARSAFHHSVNYRSVMLFGEPELLTDPEQKARQLEIFIERIAPGRWPHLRPMQDNELKATGIMSMAIDEGSAKVRAAPPSDDEADYDWPIWAGVLPLQRHWGDPEACPRLASNHSAPEVPLT
ncbi:MAG: pyridoxamine 5'-phosphate oxidase family protein [Motiliproteus sp.]